MPKILFAMLLLLVLVACSGRSQKPADDPMLNPEDTSYTIVLEGYKDREERRTFKDLLDTYDAYGEAKQTNAGAAHAEYLLTPKPDQPDWIAALTQALSDRYTIQQDGKRILFIRK